jgi:hypothetical protein
MERDIDKDDVDGKKNLCLFSKKINLNYTRKVRFLLSTSLSSGFNLNSSWILVCYVRLIRNLVFEMSLNRKNKKPAFYIGIF